MNRWFRIDPKNCPFIGKAFGRYSFRELIPFSLRDNVMIGETSKLSARDIVKFRIENAMDRNVPSVRKIYSLKVDSNRARTTRASFRAAHFFSPPNRLFPSIIIDPASINVNEQRAFVPGTSLRMALKRDGDSLASPSHVSLSLTSVSSGRAYARETKCSLRLPASCRCMFIAALVADARRGRLKPPQPRPRVGFCWFTGGFYIQSLSPSFCLPLSLPLPPKYPPRGSSHFIYSALWETGETLVS